MIWTALVLMHITAVLCNEEDGTAFIDSLILKQGEHLTVPSTTKHLILNQINGTIYPETLSQLSDLEKLTIQFSNFDEIKHASLCQSPKLEAISIGANIGHEVTQQHFEGCQNLRTLEIKYYPFSLAPGAFETLGNLETLSTEQYAWGELKKDDFRGLNKIKKISITDGGVDKIEPGTFEDLKNLEELILNNNKLETINGDEFRGLSSLKILNIDFNPTVSLNVDGILKNVPNAKSVYIPYYYYHSLSEDEKQEVKEKFEKVGIAQFFS